MITFVLVLIIIVGLCLLFGYRNNKIDSGISVPTPTVPIEDTPIVALKVAAKKVSKKTIKKIAKKAGK